jgi:hypothetical protein
MIRIIGAILGGYIAIGVLAALTDVVLGAMIPGFHAMTTPPLYYFVIVTCTDTLYTIGGGYLCAAQARGSARTATFGLMIFGEIAGIGSRLRSRGAKLTSPMLPDSRVHLPPQV